MCATTLGVGILDVDATVVIGSGPGGAAVAYGLTKAGKKVLIVEGGAVVSTAGYALNQRHFPVAEPFRPHPVNDRVVGHDPQLLKDLAPWFQSSDASLHQRRSPQVQRVKGWGGTSLHYEGQMVRMHPRAFSEGDPWPVTYAALQPYFAQLETILRVAGDVAVYPWRAQEALPVPAHDLSATSKHFQVAAKKLGWRFGPQSLAVLREATGDRGACIRCASCVEGCTTGAKASMDVTLLRDAERTGLLERMLGATVIQLICRDRRVTEALAVDRTGTEIRIRAPKFVLAAGAIETPRLLLHSGRQAGGPGRFGNQSGYVGRHYCETNIQVLSGLLDPSLKSFAAVTVDNAMTQFAEPNSESENPFVLHVSAGAARLTSPLRHAQRFFPSLWGQDLQGALASTFGGGIAVFASGASASQYSNAVALSDSELDEHGVPLASVRHHLGASDAATLVRQQSAAHDFLQAAGAVQIETFLSSFAGPLGTEPRGTCRMSTKPADGVVDINLRVHDLDNLYVSDASVFRTAGVPANPSLTIMALGSRLAEHLAGAA